MKITNRNSKLGVDIPSINLPAGITCRADAPCCRECYAKRGNFMYPNVKLGYHNNLLDYQEDRDKYFDDIIGQLKNGLTIYKYCRWHGSGDIVDYNYLEGMVKVAKKCKDTKFLCFTKKYEIVNRYLALYKLPKNLIIVFSGWGEKWHFDNPFNLPVAEVNLPNENMNFRGYFKCKGKCDECLHCWKMKKNDKVVFNKH